MKKCLYAIFLGAIILFVVSSVLTINASRERIIKDIEKEVHEKVEEQKTGEPVEEPIAPQDTQNGAIENDNGAIEPVYEEVEEKVPISNSYTTRMTSFWSNDGYGTGECTGSGLCSWDFQVNDKGWYTYQGKLVVATATVYLANQGWYVAEGVHLYKYWEELVLTIDGVEYEAIILDSCGSSMRTDRVDLFVSNGSSAKDTMIEVRRR